MNLLLILGKEFQVVHIKEMIYHSVIINFTDVSCIIKKFTKGYQSNTEQNGRKENPRETMNEEP